MSEAGFGNRESGFGNRILGFVFLVLGFTAHLLHGQDKADEIDRFLRLCHEYRMFSGTVLVAEN